MAKYIKRNEEKNKLTKKEIDELSRDLKTSRFIIEVLGQRGLGAGDIRNFLDPKIKNFHDPFLFKDMDKAVKRTWDAINKGEHIVIWGDFDCDGVCSTSSMYLEFEKAGANVSYHIPDRIEDGYGVNKKGIKMLKDERNASLIITVDCGITSNDEIEYAKTLGIDFIVTDHHRADYGNPNAYAIINPNAEGETYPFKGLAGAGVAGKFIHAMFGINSFLSVIDIISIATVADLVPLVDENRIITTIGLYIVNQRMRPAIMEMTKVLFPTFPEKIEAYHYGFYYGAMINAAGRLANSNMSVEMFTTPDIGRASEIAAKLYEYNEIRKSIEKDIIAEAQEILVKKEPDKCIVVYKEGWEPGVVGIVASRLTEDYHLPSIVLSYDPETGHYRGSGRSIPGIDLYDILKNNEEYLGAWGGHAPAAGLTVTGNIDDFERSVNEYINKKYKPEDFLRTMKYDIDLDVDNVSYDLVKDLSKIEPTGIGNPKIVFRDNKVDFTSISKIGKDKNHISGFLKSKTPNLKFIGFNQEEPSTRESLDVLYQPEINSWQGRENLQVALRNINEPNKYTDMVSEYSSSLLDIDIPISDIITLKSKVNQFKNAGIESALELLHYTPRSYTDLRTLHTVGSTHKLYSEIELMNRYLPEDKQKKIPDVNIIGYVTSFRNRGGNVFASCLDTNGEKFSVAFFNQHYVSYKLKTQTYFSFVGKLDFGNYGPQISPKYFSEDLNEYRVILSEYKKIKGMSNEYLSNTIEKSFDLLDNVDYLEPEILERFNLKPLIPALRGLHYPESGQDIKDGLYRVNFDKMFKFNFNINSKSVDSNSVSFVEVNKRDKMDKFISNLPFTLTPDQASTVEAIYQDMVDRKPLNGLVQGDVGSGKTVVSFIPMILMAENGYQSALAAPTEVLAKQHYEELKELLAGSDITLEFLSGAVREKDKDVIKEKMRNGEVDIVIGTQALMQEDIEFKNLALVIIDEQQRFGVEQREFLLNRAVDKPHVITMSATPIPRTLSMALYGDMIKIFNIRTKPAGRKPIETRVLFNDDEVYGKILEEVNKGRQAYVVAPLIEASNAKIMAGIKSLEEEYEDITRYFAPYEHIKIGLISGKMKQEEINEVIAEFEKNNIQILLSTTIIEVGVNVPNATVMAIKGSDRFGLSQLHQLRGRVGRGSHQSYCVLQPSNPNDKKAQIIASTTDGFKVADEDLKLRGSGDYFGTKQSGKNKIIELMLANREIYDEIVKVNREIYKDEDRFNKYKWILDAKLVEVEEDEEGEE